MPDPQNMLKKSFNTFANPRFLSGNARPAEYAQKVIQPFANPRFVEWQCQTSRKCSKGHSTHLPTLVS
jgi:hypothetical protein